MPLSMPTSVAKITRWIGLHRDTGRRRREARTDDGVELDYELAGEGSDVIFLHAAVGDRRLWRPVRHSVTGSTVARCAGNNGHNTRAAPTRELTPVT